MSPVFAQTRLLLAPSRIQEGFGRVVVEAGLHGIPSLAADNGGLVEATGTVSGLIGGFNVETWVQEVEALDNKLEYERRSKAARIHASRFLRDPVHELVAAGVLRPKTGTGMPKKERFRHAQSGRASSSVLLSKLPVLSWTAAEAANCVLCVFLVFFN
jgi:hypothetical protein